MRFLSIRSKQQPQQSKGWTIQEFVMVNMFIPIGFIVIWFGTFGSSAIRLQMNGTLIWEAIQEYGFPVALFAYLQELPLTPILTILGFAAIALMGYILMLSGGLDSVQHSVLVLVILLINAASFVRATTNRLEYDLTLTGEQRNRLIAEKEAEE